MGIVAWYKVVLFCRISVLASGLGCPGYVYICRCAILSFPSYFRLISP